MVWNTTMFFFQTILFAGYLYAQASGQWAPRRKTIPLILHAILLFIAVALLPKEPHLGYLEYSSEGFQGQALRILGTLLLWVGFVYWLLAANSTLIQKWFSWTSHPQAKDPYFLYAAGNLGSLLGLLAYPLFFEIFLGLKEQWIVFKILSGTLLALLVVIGFMIRDQIPSVSVKFAQKRSASPPRFSFFRWGLFAATTSLLLMGNSLYLSTDVVSFPFFWVLPLALFLLSYIVAFSTFEKLRTFKALWLEKIACFLIFLSLVSVSVTLTHHIWFTAALHLLTLFFACTLAHTQLAETRPPAQYLGGFYTSISLGGLIGGWLAVFVFPQISQSILEYDIALLMILALRLFAKPATYDNLKKEVFFPIVLLVLVSLAVLGLFRVLGWHPSSTFAVLITTCVVGLILYANIRRPLTYLVGLFLAYLSFILFYQPNEAVLFRDRSFYGTLKVTQDREGVFRSLVHGTTLHGKERITDPVPEAISYYHRQGPIGVIFSQNQVALTSIGVIGLGVGGLLSYATADQSWVFYELDPHVVKVAEDPKFFRFVSTAKEKTDLKIKVGDGRLLLASEPDGLFDLIVVDAFSSDGIPFHLLTEEALQLYFQKLKPDGLLALHISNRFFNFESLLHRISQNLALPLWLGISSTVDEELGVNHSSWAFFSKSSAWEKFMENQINSKGEVLWRKPIRIQSRSWTDQRSSLFDLYP